MDPLHEHDPLAPHSHEPNPSPPSPDSAFTLITPDGQPAKISVQALQKLPPNGVAECYIVSTGHGTSGPFVFNGVRLIDLIRSQWNDPFSQVEVVSGDGFGTRVSADELLQTTTRPILLAYGCNGTPLKRTDGLVRLIVPSEVDDALRQVKWVDRIQIIGL